MTSQNKDSKKPVIDPDDKFCPSNIMGTHTLCKNGRPHTYKTVGIRICHAWDDNRRQCSLCYRRPMGP